MPMQKWNEVSLRGVLVLVLALAVVRMQVLLPVEGAAP